MMKTLLERLVLIILSASHTTVEVSAIGIHGALCPANCSCSIEGSRLTVDCLGQADIDGEDLLRQLDILLTSNLTHGHLTELSIINSPLRRVPRSICRLSTLTQLHLDNNRLTRLPDNCLSNLTALVSLTATRNNITELQDGLFDGLDRLERLVLSFNRISSIGLRVLNGSATLTRLRYVDLQHNSLQTLEPWFSYVSVNGEANNMAVIQLAYNNISTFTNTMGWKPKRAKMKEHYFDLVLDANPIRHLTDILRGWNMTLWTAWTSSPFSSRSYSLSLRNVRLHCDCIDFDVFKLAKIPYFHVHFLSGVYCDTPATLYERQVLTVSLDQFVCVLTKHCPPGCRCVHRPENATLHVYCSDTNIKVLPSELPELPKSYTRYHLDFSNNRLLRRLEHRDYFVNTYFLDLTNCNIGSVDFRLMNDLSNVARVSLDGNQLQSLPSLLATTSLDNRSELSLSRNPWKCSCDSSWMSGWLKLAQSSIVDADGIVCSSPPRLENRNVVGLSDEEFCEDPASRAAKKALTISMSTVAGVLLVLLSTCIVVYRLRVKLYTRWKLHPFDRDTCHGEDLDYDVFLASSSGDNLPHGNGIRQELEHRGYRVCYPPRDFLAGGTIHENIYNAVVRSKRVVCLLTAGFLGSGYCMQEFDVAFHHNIMVKRKNRLIVLMALDSPFDLYAGDASDLSALRQYLRQYTYIDYTADDWLDRLLYALPPSGMNRVAGVDAQSQNQRDTDALLMDPMEDDQQPSLNERTDVGLLFLQ